MSISRRGFLITGAAAAGVRAVPGIASKPAGKRVLELVYDKSLGMMRAVERIIR